MYSQSFSDLPIDGSLISGFLSAVGTFGAEIARGGSENGPLLNEIAYSHFMINIVEGEYVKVAVLLKKSATDNLKQRISNFVAKFEEEFAADLVNYCGKLLARNPIDILVEDTMQSDLLYPHMLASKKGTERLKTTSKKSTEANIIRALSSSAFEGTGSLREILSHLSARGIKEVETFIKIKELRRDGIIFAVNPRTSELITKFKPLIDPLDDWGKKLLPAILQGTTTLKELAKKFKGAPIGRTLAHLENHGLLGRDNDLTSEGEIVATLLSLLPDL